MATDTGLSQSAISNVVTGRRAPGRKILATVSAHPLVNATWLLTGEGEPLVMEEQPGHAGRHFCPVAGELLTGSPRDCRDRLTGQYRPVAAPDYGECRYWFQLATDEFIDRGFAPGDWLLMDTDGFWLQRPTILTGQPCVVLSGNKTTPTLNIRFLRYDPKMKPAGKYVVDALVASQEQQLPWRGRNLRNIRIRTEAKGTVVKSKKVVPPSIKTADLVPLKKILAVAVKLERQWP